MENRTDRLTLRGKTGKIIAGILVWAAVLVLFPIMPYQRTISLQWPFQKEQGFCWIVVLPQFGSFSDNSKEPARSGLIVLEDGKALGPAHSIHGDIRKEGDGRYSHWSGAVYFSTSDNSDPNDNRRRYSAKYAVYPTNLNPKYYFIIYIALFFASVVLVIKSLKKGFFEAVSWVESRWVLHSPVTTVTYLCGLIMIPFLTYGLISSDHVAVKADINGKLSDKLAYYKDHAKDFDVVFLGDSRTYTNIHSHLVDPLIGKRSFNLGMFSHWFPTQYPFIRDFANIVPPGTTVVWSVGHQNFFSSPSVQRIYSIKLSDVPQYLLWGYSWSAISDNVMYYNRFLNFYSRRGELRENILKKSNMILFNSIPAVSFAQTAGEKTLPSQKYEPPQQEMENIRKFYEGEPFTSTTSLISDGDLITSIVINTKSGSYLKVELEPEYFRKKQDEMRPKGKYLCSAKPERANYETFKAILDIFRRKGVHLIVNEIEEAPFNYFDREVRESFRTFMSVYARQEVLRRGFVYITTELDQLKDEDFFDYNHCNSQGAAKYAPILAKALRNYIK